MNLRALGSIIGNPLRRFGRAGGWDLAGVISFFLTMSIVSGVVLGSYATGLFYDGRSLIADTMRTVVGPHAADIFTDLLARASGDWQTVVAVAFVAVAFVGSSLCLLIRTHRAVNWILGIETRPSGWAWLKLWSKRLGSSLLVVLSGLLLTVTFSLKTALELFDYVGIQPVADYIWWFRAGEIVLALGLATLLYGWLLRAMIDAEVPRASLWQGAFFGAKLYTAVQIVAAFAIVYLGGMSYYGEAAVVVVLLAYIYFSAASFFLGVEFVASQLKRSEAELEPSSFARLRRQPTSSTGGRGRT